MKSKLNNNLIICILCLAGFAGLSYSCKQKKKEKYVGLEVSSAYPKEILLDSMEVSEETPIGKIETKLLGKPKETPFSNISKPINWKKTKAGVPKKFTLGSDSVPLPKVVAAVHKPKRAGVPKINMAKPSFSKDINPYNFTIFGLKEGLIENQIHRIFQDKKGNIWMGSFNGISKFNGHTFENYSKNEGLVDNFYQCGMEDRNGNIWLGFREGLTKFDGVNFTNYTTHEGLSSANIEAIIEDKNGNIWIGTVGGGVSVLALDGRTFTHYGPEQGMSISVLGIAEDNRGNLWFATQDLGLIKFDFKSFYRFGYYEGLSYVTVNDVKVDKNGDLWLAMWTGVSRFDGTNFYHLTNHLPKYASNLSFDQFNNIWFGAMPGGVFKIDNDFTNITSYTSREGLPNEYVICSMVDKNNNLWFGTDNGLVKHSKLVSNLTTKDGLVGNELSCVLLDFQKNIWVGTTDAGISKIDFKDKKIKNFTPKEGLTDSDITSMMQDKEGNIWCGTAYFPMFRLNADGKTISHFPEGGNFVVCIFEDREGNIWYSSRDKKGVFKYNKKTNTITRFDKKQGLPHDQVVRIWQDSGDNMWFCTFNGVSRLDKNGKNLSNFTEKEGFKLGVVESIVEDQNGNFWFSNLSSGVTFLNYKRKKFIYFSEKDGLSNNTVFGILKDHAGNLWFNTRNGLSKLSNKVVEQLASDSPLLKPIYFKNYTSEQGYLGFGSGRFDIVEDSSGKIWIPMLDRLTIFDPKEEGLNIQKPTVELTSIKLFNEDIIWQKDTRVVLKNGVIVAGFDFEKLSKWHNLPEELELAHGNNYLNFEFSSVNVNAPQKIMYQYMLEGLENTWSVPSPKSEAAYGNLPSGKYVFKAKSRNEDDNWSEELNYSFVIHPPFWKTWWAFLLYFLVFASGVYYFIQFKVKQKIKKIKELEAMRVRISSNLHDDVGTILSGLAMQSQMMAITAQKEQKGALLELSKMSHEAMERMRDTVWAIDSRKDKYENLIDKMREYVEKNLHLKNIKHTFKVEIEDPKKFIEPEIRQNIYLITKEAIANICKHSDATNVEIKFLQIKNHLELVIMDNGTLLKPINDNGMGLQNMKMRAKKMGATLDHRLDNGCMVRLQMGI